MIDWTVIGQIGGMILSGVVGWFVSKGKREVSAAQDSAQIAGYTVDKAAADAQASQITQLITRVTSLESQYSALWGELQTEKAAGSKLRDRVRQLEGILRANNITIPAE